MVETLTEEEIELLAKEMKIVVESVQGIFNTNSRKFMPLCLSIIDEENEFDENEDSRFNYRRREIAENILALID